MNVQLCTQTTQLSDYTFHQFAAIRHIGFGDYPASVVPLTLRRITIFKKI